MVNEKHIGSSFDDFLMEEGIYTEVTYKAVKRVLAWQISNAMKKGNISKTKMAGRMKTSRAALDRLLDPDNASVTLRTMDRAATALGKRLHFELVDEPRV